MEGVEKINQAADRLIKLGEHHGNDDWLVVAGCSHLRLMVRVWNTSWCFGGKFKIAKQCLGSNYPRLLDAAVHEVLSGFR